MTVISFPIMLEPKETYTVNLNMMLREAGTGVANYTCVGDVCQVGDLEILFILHCFTNEKSIS